MSGSQRSIFGEWHDLADFPSKHRNVFSRLCGAVIVFVCRCFAARRFDLRGGTTSLPPIGRRAVYAVAAPFFQPTSIRRPHVLVGRFPMQSRYAAWAHRQNQRTHDV